MSSRMQREFFRRRILHLGYANTSSSQNICKHTEGKSGGEGKIGFHFPTASPAIQRTVRLLSALDVDNDRRNSETGCPASNARDLTRNHASIRSRTAEPRTTEPVRATRAYKIAMRIFTLRRLYSIKEWKTDQQVKNFSRMDRFTAASETHAPGERDEPI
ncbi:hypothetical protein HPP92_028785 [Vanilla planifolia]|uniref:Uncharacterized protein n=1 Tax=Vanilla planifolia TaxID=51239 RepID=A0A835U570_VANPL|nr:hypothetical protein HPP92_028785 [Vanilla planifolia]KAG0446574.1 hypothetical protein HPP92_028774 [Vanilla planifolia]